MLHFALETALVLGAVALVFLGASGYGLYALGLQRGAAAGPASVTAASAAIPAVFEPVPQGIAAGEDATRRHISSGIKAGDIDPVTGKKVLYYHDPMVPGNKFDQPAKSPFMDMMLVPVYADSEGADSSRVTVSPRIQQNLGLRSTEVVEAMLSPQLQAVGTIAWNERDLVVVQARATGYVEKLHLRAALDTVTAGRPLAEIYVPEWIAAQEEFLALRRMQGRDLAPLVDGARQRMRQVGMSPAQIERIESSGSTHPRITLYAPIDGIVTELLLREGMTVMAGATLLRINGSASVWAQAAVPESQVALLRPGTKVQARSPALPGETFNGRVQALLPEVDAATRTRRARVELANPRGRLVPGMFVQMQFSDLRATKALVIPTEAVIQTGTRTLVMLAEADGRFRPVEVQTGIEVDGRTEVRAGLQAGQRVVVSSQFLIDSEASLKGVEARLNAEPAPTTAAVATHQTEARVEGIEPDALTLSHGPIASLKWGAMTMDFKPPKAGLPRGLAVGDRIDMSFVMEADGLPQITRLRLLGPRGPAKAAAPANAGSKP